MCVNEAADGVQHGNAIVGRELKAGGNAGRNGGFIGIDDRVRQAAGSGNDRHAAVAQTAVKLRAVRRVRSATG